jgi:hypothetical protein
VTVTSLVKALLPVLESSKVVAIDGKLFMRFEAHLESLEISKDAQQTYTWGATIEAQTDGVWTTLEDFTFQLRAGNVQEWKRN